MADDLDKHSPFRQKYLSSLWRHFASETVEEELELSTRFVWESGVIPLDHMSHHPRASPLCRDTRDPSGSILLTPTHTLLLIYRLLYFSYLNDLNYDVIELNNRIIGPEYDS